MQRMTDFAKHTLMTMGSKIVVLSLGLVISILLARGLGPEGRGYYTLAILYPTLIVTFINFGLGSSSVYYIAQGKHTLKEVFSTDTMISLTLGVVGIVIGLLLPLLFPSRIFPDVPQRFLLIALLLVPLNLFSGQVGTQVLLGARRISEFNLSTIINNLAFVILLAVSLLVVKADVMGAVSANILSTAFFCILLFILVYRIAGGFSFKFSRAYLRDAISYGSKTYLGSIISFLNYRIELFMLGIMMPAAALGYYSVAVGLAERLWLVSQSAAMLIFPTIAAEQDEGKRNQFTPVISRNVLLITFLGALAFFLISPWLITLLYSESFQQTIQLFRILLPGVVFLSGSRVLANDIAGRGKPLLNTYVGGFGLLIQVGMNLVLIPRYGAAGSAAATSLTYGLIMIIRSWLYWRISGNRPASFLLPAASDLVLYRQLLIKSWKWFSAKVIIPLTKKD